MSRIRCPKCNSSSLKTIGVIPPRFGEYYAYISSVCVCGQKSSYVLQDEYIPGGFSEHEDIKLFSDEFEAELKRYMEEARENNAVRR